MDQVPALRWHIAGRSGCPGASLLGFVGHPLLEAVTCCLDRFVDIRPVAMRDADDVSLPIREFTWQHW